MMKIEVRKMKKRTTKTSPKQKTIKTVSISISKGVPRKGDDRTQEEETRRKAETNQC